LSIAFFPLLKSLLLAFFHLIFGFHLLLLLLLLLLLVELLLGLHLSLLLFFLTLALLKLQVHLLLHLLSEMIILSLFKAKEVCEALDQGFTDIFLLSLGFNGEFNLGAYSLS